MKSNIHEVLKKLKAPSRHDESTNFKQFAYGYLRHISVTQANSTVFYAGPKKREKEVEMVQDSQSDNVTTIMMMKTG